MYFGELNKPIIPKAKKNTRAASKNMILDEANTTDASPNLPLQEPIELIDSTRVNVASRVVAAENNPENCP